MSLQEALQEEVYSWMAESKNNCIEPGSVKPAFDRPLLGYGHGADPLFQFLKEDIGSDFYWTPVDAYRMAYGKEVEPQNLTVVSWVLPQTEATKKAHKLMVDMPSIEWSRGRLYGEQVNEKLRKHVVMFCASRGIQAFAPTLLANWERAISNRYGFASSWSERHAAYVCGLGTFGLSDGLITSVGKAIRVGSVIIKAPIPATKRNYDHHNAYCLHHSLGKCDACIQRCPVGAITPEGHDKQKCKKYIREVTAPYVEKEQLGVPVNSCGLCQTGVPCASINPMEKILKKMAQDSASKRKFS